MCPNCGNKMVRTGEEESPVYSRCKNCGYEKSVLK